MPTSTKNFLLFLSAVILIFVFGFVVGSEVSRRKLPALPSGLAGQVPAGSINANANVNAGANAAPSAPSLAGRRLYLQGTVKELGSGKIVLEYNAADMDSEKSGMAVKDVLVGEKTKIARLARKDADAWKAEQEEFIKKIQELQAAGGMAANTEELVPPAPYNSTDIQLSDLRTGDTIRVRTENPYVYSADTFTARTIETGELGEELAVFPK